MTCFSFFSDLLVEIHSVVFGFEQETFVLVCQQKLPKRPQDIQKEID